MRVTAVGRVAFLCLTAAGPARGQFPPATFNPGIYYRLPNTDNTDNTDTADARLTRLDDPLLPEIQMSPDCRRVAVQASATPDIVGGVEDLNIYVIDLETGAPARIGDLPWNEESPRFFPVGSRLAYSSFSPTAGVNLHVYDFDQGREILRALGIGALQIAISPNGDRVLDPRKMRIYDAATGAVTADFLAALVATLPATGFALDERFKNEPGMPNKGLYPLDARQLTVLTDLIPANPEFTNHNNFSQLNPVWK